MRERPTRESSWERYGVLSQVILAGASLIAVFVSLNQSLLRGAIPAWTVLIAVVGTFYVVSMVWLLRYLRRTRYYDFRLALTGQPGSGKTVLSILLYDRLMSNRDEDVSFTADSRSAIATYQAIRGIPADEWPPATSKGTVLQYDGALRFRQRDIVDLEIGDSAGEYWLDLSRSEGDPSYLQYVISAHAIGHVISSEFLLSDDPTEIIARDLEDLRLAAQLMRSTRADFSSRPLLIVISKVDKLLPDVPANELLVCYEPTAIHHSPLVRALSDKTQADISSLLQGMGENLSREFKSVTFTFSSVVSARPSIRPPQTRRDDVLAWIYDSVTRDSGTRYLLPFRRLGDK